MPKRGAHQNIPTDIIRTAVMVAGTGSLTRAASKLGLSQPAVTSQIKRIEKILGGLLFMKSSNGSVPTDFGLLFLDHARRMLDANDRILQLGGLSRRLPPVRLGISSLFFQDFTDRVDAHAMENVTIQVEGCTDVARSLVEAHLDVACILDNSKFTSDVLSLVIGECSEPFAWVRAPHFKLSPGKPVPVLVSPRDEFLLTALARQGLAYNIVLQTGEYYAKLLATAAGLGITAIPRRLIPSDLVAADDCDCLPTLPAVRGLLCARANVQPPARQLADHILERYFRINRSAPVVSDRAVLDRKASLGYRS